MSQRKPFLEKLTELAEKDSSVILIVGDVGFSFIEGFKERFPKQFINIGINEQSMMGIAAGMAQQGLKPYVYTMTNFILLRPLEQLRNDICYANANVKLFGVKGGESYKFLGFSHNMTKEETLGILQPLKNANLEFYIPAGLHKDDEKRFLKEMDYEYQRNGPAYFQI